jgi:hypothetical protein
MDEQLDGRETDYPCLGIRNGGRKHVPYWINTKGSGEENYMQSDTLLVVREKNYKK